MAGVRALKIAIFEGSGFSGQVKLPSSFSPLNPHYASSAMHLAIATVATTHPTVHAQKRPGPNRQSAHCAGAKRPCEEASGVGEKESGCTSDTGHLHLKTEIKQFP